jgi:5'-phosphate synthase pdxT subunit
MKTKSHHPNIQTSKYPKIGVLALQGAVEPHRAHIEACGGEFRAVKTPAQFAEVDGFILPGGESTTMLKLIDTFGLWDVLAQQFNTKPVWGICAGAILLAEHVTNPAQKSSAILPLSVQRNGYGRQLESHFADIDDYEVAFIRAPVFTVPSPSIPLPEGRGKPNEERQGEGLKILANHQDLPVWVQYGDKMATSFHPEMNLSPPSPMHRMFVDLVRESA